MHGSVDAAASWSEDLLRRFGEGVTKAPVTWPSMAPTLADADAMSSEVFGESRLEESVMGLGLLVSEVKHDDKLEVRAIDGKQARYILGRGMPFRPHRGSQAAISGTPPSHGLRRNRTESARVYSTSARPIPGTMDVSSIMVLLVRRAELP